MLGCWLTLVNGTPYTWTKEVWHQHQMHKDYDVNNFPSNVAPFSKVDCKFIFDDDGLFKKVSDSECWAEYQIQGTSSRFQVWLNRKILPNWKLCLSQMKTLCDQTGTDVDLGFVNDKDVPEYHYNGTTLFITGVDGLFVTTSRNPVAPWMWRYKDLIGDRTLRQICMPGTHNSGTGRITRTAFGTPNSAISCQSGSVWDQLRLGVRFFDIRPCWSKSGGYATGHYSENSTPLGKKVFGGSGQTIADIVNNVNDFTYNNAEVIILNISHDQNLDDGVASWPNSWWSDFCDTELDRLTHRFCTDGNGDLSNMKLDEFIGQGRAAVIVRFAFKRSEGHLGHREGNGYYYADSLPLFDEYADNMDPREVIKHQLGKLNEQRVNPNRQMFILSWAQTQKTFGDVAESYAKTGSSLTALGKWAMAPRLGYDLIPHTSSKVYPNVLALDGVDTTQGVAAAIAINLRAQP
ncbi:PLC-like phosphodiesterase [Xylariaceae sp. FL1019]|nr:PLC-like phosphodiesterase [Xylariaceae sp. FL1019]